jgi:tetratricopeptide (TPR) repeat protein
MEQPKRLWTAVLVVCALSLAAVMATNALAQNSAPAKIHGQVTDVQGNPFTNVVVSMKNTTTGQVTDLTSDSGGRYRSGNLPAGNYTVSVKIRNEVAYTQPIVLSPGQDFQDDFDFKAMQAKQGAEAAEVEKKNSEAREKFTSMKQHFDAGTAALEQAKQTRAQLDKLPKDQQASTQGQLDQSTGTAVSEFNTALEGTAENDPNRHILLARLGEAYEVEGKFPEAAGSYQKAVALKPDPSYYNNLGNSLARTGKVDDALAAYQKAVELDPMNTAIYWRNFSIGLYNSGRIKESLEPLKKATEADPKNAQAWYLMGAALVNTMDFKQEGDKVIPIMQPGTQEAYQKAIDLDPNGPWGAQAKQGLEALQAMGVGIDIKVNQRKNTPPPAPKGKK